eukprot:COSAG05_NODE_716_length_7804_cov_2.669825_15_plen_164_part_00
MHDGDPGGEGVIWPHIAEVSLLGGLGCGGVLLKMVLEELESPNSQYDHVVLQASENSVGFYEHHGFVRIGAIARYEEAGAGVAHAVLPSPVRLFSHTVSIAHLLFRSHVLLSVLACMHVLEELLRDAVPHRPTLSHLFGIFRSSFFFVCLFVCLFVCFLGGEC